VTIPVHGTDNLVWLREKTALLRVCHQLHEESADVLYGSNTFVINVAYDRIEFLYRWLLPSGLTPKRVHPFLKREQPGTLKREYFPQRYIPRIRSYLINVEHVGSYMGMIKYNCGGKGLTIGIRRQVQTLVDELRKSPHLNRVVVRLIDDNTVLSQIRRVRVHRMDADKNTVLTQTVLDPFLDLTGVRCAEIVGAVNPDYKSHVRQRMEELGQ
jgi:hypothetical protein